MDRPAKNFAAVLAERWFDFRRQGEGMDEGSQSQPVNWSLNSDRKRGSSKYLAEITGA